jgi:PAS domain S-box-containing protein
MRREAGTIPGPGLGTGEVMMVVDEAVLRDPVRLAAVDRARRTAPDLRIPLDAVARLAARLLKAPIGLVTFVGDDEEHFVGMHGMPWSLAAGRHAPMAYSVCKYMVSADHPVSCGDMSAEQDPQIRGHPLVTEFGVRAFLGVPLRDADGQLLGSLSVLDTAARHWPDDAVSALVEIAGLVATVPVATSRVPQTVTDLDTGDLLDGLQEAFLAVDVDGVVVGWNAAARDLLGFETGQVCGRPVQDTVLPEYGGRPVGEALARLFAAPKPPRMSRRVTLLHRDGHEIFASVALSMVRGPGGPLACAFVTDRSAQVVAEDDAEQQQRFLTALLDSLLVGVVACDADGRIKVVNRAMRRVEQLPESGELGPHHIAAGAAMLHHADGTPMARDDTPLMHARLGEIVREVDLMVRAPGQRVRLFAANAQPITGGDGRRWGAVVAMHEVTAVRRAERFRDCHARVLRAMAEASSPAEVAPAVLEAVATALGWPHAELWLIDEVTDTLHATGHWTAAGFPIDDHVGGPVVKGVGITGTVWATGQRLWVPDITDTPHLVTEESLARAEACAERGLHSVLAVPVRDGDTLFGVLSCYADTTEVHEDLLTVLLDGVAAQIGQFVALRRAQELAHELTRAKDDFLALVGHEMRTPLTAITASATMLADDREALDDDQRVMVATIERKTAVLRAIIDALLDIAGLESGNLELATGEFDVVDVAATALTAAETAAAAGRVRIHAHLPHRLPMSGDAHRFQQVIEHLLANAITYSPGGEVHLHLAAQHGVVELEVHDNGIGVPEGEHEHLFDRFYRAVNVRHQGIPGHGLGLSRVRAIVERQGGTVTLDTHQPTGTSVLIRLPQNRSTEEPLSRRR